MQAQLHAKKARKKLDKINEYEQLLRALDGAARGRSLGGSCMGLACWLVLLVVMGAVGVAWVAASDAVCARVMSPLVLEVQKTGLQNFDVKSHEPAIVRAGEKFVTNVDAGVRIAGLGYRA